jgi:hypothetical protein
LFTIMSLQFLPCLSRDLGQLLADTDTSDVIVRVRNKLDNDDNAEESVFRAHSQIIGARCRKLRELIDTERKTTEGIGGKFLNEVVITLPDMTSKIFEVLLEWVYYLNYVYHFGYDSF